MLEILTDGQRVRVLAALLVAHPDLVAEADELARAHLGATDHEVVRQQLTVALLRVPMTAVGERSGRQRGRGYVEPEEACYQLLREVLAPFLDEIGRRAAVDLGEAAVGYGLALLDGLYRLRDHDGDDSALRWCGPDRECWELATSVVRAWEDAGIPPPSDRVDAICPEWAGLA